MATCVYKAMPNNSDNKSLELGLCWSLARRVGELNSSGWVKMGQKHVYRLGESTPNDRVKIIEGSKACAHIRGVYSL